MSEGTLHPDLERILTETPEDAMVPVIVRYKPMPVGVITAAIPSDMTVMASYRIVPASAMEGAPAAIRSLAENPMVERIWYDYPVHTMLDQSVPLIGAPQVWAASGQGQGIRVAVLDTGCDLNHPDIKERISGQQDFSGKGDVQDGNGHGTHVAGIIAGSGEAGGGRYRGVAPKSELFIAKVLSDDGSGRMSGVIAGLEWALDQNVHVVNMSLGSDIQCDGTDALSEACDAAVAEGVVVVVAAGNAGPRPRTVGSPGCAREVITVGASTDNDTIADFSSRGPTKDGRVKPDICFPGYKIIAPRASGTALGRVIDDYYTELSGTSMATPHATGVVALLLEAEPDLTPRQVKERLMATAVDMGLDKNAQGAGRGDAHAAWQAGQTEPEPTPEPTPEPEPEPTPEPEPEPTPEPEPEPTPEPKPPKPIPAPGGCLLALLRAFSF
ncbi:MAG: S8 family peptidase [Chloroflexi bacterium]|nr:S8 family peptidase [Chloroflexota bacterium]